MFYALSFPVNPHLDPCRPFTRMNDSHDSFEVNRVACACARNLSLSSELPASNAQTQEHQDWLRGSG